MATVTKTDTFYLTGYDADLSTIKSASNINNFIGKSSTNSSYGQFSLVNGASAWTYVYLTFDLSSIPKNAIVESVKCKLKIVRTGTATYVKSCSARGYKISGETGEEITIGFSKTFTNTVSTLDMGWGVSHIQNTINNNDTLMIRAQAQRGTSNTTTAYYINIYGADLTVTYSYEEGPTDSLYIKNNGLWVPVTKAFKKVSGAWVEESDLTQVFDSNNEYIRGN